MTSGEYIRVWEYEVSAAHVDAFVAAYGGDGEWVQLFRRGQGYAGTQLYRGVDAPARFLTVDRWSDEASWRAFLSGFHAEYEVLDARLEGLSLRERPLLEG